MRWVELIISIIAGLGAAIPLVIKLVEYIQLSVKEKNWVHLVNLVLKYMQIAEDKFTDGTSRKEYVMKMIKEGAAMINYDLDDDALQKISALIDSICTASKIINTPKITESSTTTQA
jgi:hypothetical protein